MATERTPERPEVTARAWATPPPPDRLDQGPAPEPPAAEAGHPAAPPAPAERPRASRPPLPVAPRPGTDRLIGDQRPLRVPERELDSNGVPIMRRKGMVADIHRKAQRQIEHQRERQSERAALAPATGDLDPLADPAATNGHTLPLSAPGPSVGALAAPPGPPPARHGSLPSRAAAPLQSQPAASQERRASVPSHPSTPPPAAPAAPDPAPVPRSPVLPVADGVHSSKLNPEWLALWRAAYLARQPRHRCATCRSFRAGDGHGPGWCSNARVFPAPQFVNPDDLACLGPLGDWWIESDQRWLAHAGTPPTEPTPLADGLIHLLTSMPLGMHRR